MEDVILTESHWIFLLVIVTIIMFMIFRRSVILPAILGIFILGIMHNFEAGFAGALMGGLQVLFNAFINGASELLDIMIVIALMVALLNALQSQGADSLMVAPLKKLMVNTTSSFFILGITMYVAAIFFWPTPAIALVGTILIPLAIQRGLPAIGAAASVNLMGHGMALSADPVIQGATTLTSTASGISTAALLPFTILFSFIVGVVAVGISFAKIKIDLKKGVLRTETKTATLADESEETLKEVAATIEEAPPTKRAKFLAVFVPLILLTIVVTMIVAAVNGNAIEGGNATALLGGSAVALLIIASALGDGSKCLENIGTYIREGFLFAIKIFSIVIPIAAFFFLGEPEQAEAVLGEGAPGYLFDIGAAAMPYLEGQAITITIGIVLVALLAGMDGSGFSGLPLVGALAAAFGDTPGVDVAVLASLGQVVTIFVGGGTLAAWAFGAVADAGIARVSPLELVRRNFIPVMAGIFVALIIALIIM